MKIDQPNDLVTWVVETSHLANVPEYYEAGSVTELRHHVQLTADRRPPRPDRPPFGELSFRYELDADGYIAVVHSYFTNRHGKQARFMRLRRKDLVDVRD